MFKVSQKIRLKSQHHSGGSDIRYLGSGTHNVCDTGESEYVFGKYQRTPDPDAYPTDERHVFIAPELTDPSKVQLVHFPSGVVRLKSEVRFIIKRNGVKGNFEVKLESPSNELYDIPLTVLDPERFEVVFTVQEAGLYRVHCKCNSVPLPPQIIIVISGDATIVSDDESID